MRELASKGKEANNAALWSEFRSTAERFERQRVASESGLAFLFTEGALGEKTLIACQLQLFFLFVLNHNPYANLKGIT